MINRVVLVGRLVKDVELRTATSGRPIASFTLAVDNRQKDESGKLTTSFIGCVAFGNSAENLSKFTRKGSLIGIDGVLNQRKYQRKDGTNASVIEVLCDSVKFLESKKQNYDDVPPFDEAESPATKINNNDNIDQDNAEINDSLDLPEDDLPF